MKFLMGILIIWAVGIVTIIAVSSWGGYMRMGSEETLRIEKITCVLCDSTETYSVCVWHGIDDGIRAGYTPSEYTQGLDKWLLIDGVDFACHKSCLKKLMLRIKNAETNKGED